MLPNRWTSTPPRLKGAGGVTSEKLLEALGDLGASMIGRSIDWNAGPRNTEREREKKKVGKRRIKVLEVKLMGG